MSTTNPLYVILEHANLEVVQMKSGVQLINSDDHVKFIETKLKGIPEDYRPDIVHQSLMALLDTVLNKAGRLRIFIVTKKGVLIRISPSIRFPRTYKRFAGLFTELLTHGKIKSAELAEEHGKLMEVLPGTIDQHLPESRMIIGTST